MRSFRGSLICAWGEEGASARAACGTVVRSPAYPPERVIDTLGAGDTFNAAVLYYLNKSKGEFFFARKCKEEACVSDQATSEYSSEDIAASEGDTEQASRMRGTKRNRTDFINKTILLRAIKFACCIAGAKVGLRGYDRLDEISSDVLQDLSMRQES